MDHPFPAGSAGKAVRPRRAVVEAVLRKEILRGRRVFEGQKVTTRYPLSSRVNGWGKVGEGFVDAVHGLAIRVIQDISECATAEGGKEDQVGELDVVRHRIAVLESFKNQEGYPRALRDLLYSPTRTASQVLQPWARSSEKGRTAVASWALDQ